MEWAVFGYIVWGVRKRGISLRELVGPRWSKGKQNLVDLGIAACFDLTALVVLGVIGHLLHTEPNAKIVQFMMPVGWLELGMWLLLSLTAGICEETIFRGYFQRQFVGWTGNTIVGIVISAMIFSAPFTFIKARSNHRDRRVRRDVRNTRCYAKKSEARNDCARVSGFRRGNFATCWPRNMDGSGQVDL